MGWLDFADGACELVSFTVDVLAVHTMAVACGQRRLGLCFYMSVLHCGLMGHLGQRGEETETNMCTGMSKRVLDTEERTK